MSKEEEETVDQRARSPFDVTGPSQLGPVLQRGASTRASMQNSKTKKYYDGWTIGKRDPNELFGSINRSQFGTRQWKKK